MIRPGAAWSALVVGLVLAAFGLRIEAARRPGLWADEIFSLAMATGHSLEHPAAGADPARGDFVQPAELEPPALLRRYAERNREAAGAGRVVGAVLRSDTSPPLYYLLLHLWLRPFGTGDASLRLFSVCWAALALPLLWLVGREVGGERTAAAALLLFAWSPVAIYFSAEGRMYALLWCLALALAGATLRLERGPAWWPAVALVGTGVLGLLTHYFFAFVWLASLGWLWLAVTPARRRGVALLAGLTALAVVPWYLQVPASLAAWRVSGDWLDGALRWPGALARPWSLAGSLLSGLTPLGGWRRADRLALLGLAALAVFLLWWRALPRLFSRRALLLWAVLAGACAGPLVFDVLRHTTTSGIPRYALPALPAAVLLAALGLSLLPRPLSVAMVTVLLLAWLPGAWSVAVAPVPRPRQPYRELDARLAAWARPGDALIVHSIPSGVVGVARYLAADLPLASWVVQLGTRRVPADVQRLLAGRGRVAVATIHDLGAADSLLPWLEMHARPLGRDSFPDSHAEVRYFGPRRGDTFPAAPAAWE